MPSAKCELCDTTEPLPRCCDRDMLLSEEKLVCPRCGKEKPVPKCCGNQMLLLTI